MRRSVVLKDEKNKPAGYVLVSGENLICRIPLEESAQMEVLFSDGSRAGYKLEKGVQEQRLTCQGKAMRGCCVFRGTQLLYLSDEALRMDFVRVMRQQSIPLDKSHLYAAQSASEQEINALRNAELEVSSEHVPMKKNVCSDDEGFMQRRWPPPPCWPTSYYAQGCWREEEKRRK